jgi:UDP-glucose 4-epimerase
MKVLVTGAAGLIGSHMCDVLVSNGHEVIAVDDLSYGNTDNINKNVKFIEADCSTDFASLSNSCMCEASCGCDITGIDFIYHFASVKKLWDDIDETNILDVNFRMTKQVVDLAIKNNAHLVFASTSDVYGNHNTFLESDPITIGPSSIERYSYAMSKLHSEQYILNLVNKNKLDATIIRVFGCASKRSAKSYLGMHVALFTVQAINGEEITIFDDGLQTRSISHAEDVVNGFYAVIDNSVRANGEIINLGTDQQTTIKYVAKYITDRIRYSGNIKYVPMEERFKGYPEIKVRFANLDKAKELLNYNVTKTTEDVMDEIIEAWA